MFNFTEALLEKLIVHHIGNKQRDEYLRLSESELRLEESIKLLLHTYFLSPFKTDEFHHFFDENDLNENAVYAFASAAFDDPETFRDQSVNIAQRLFDQGTHPKIKSGELYVALFSNCLVGDEVCEAIGIFKSENKDTYLKVYEQSGRFSIAHDRGINIKKLDKGCLIFNTEREAGYKVCILDTLNKGGEAAFWRDNFLQVAPRADDYYFTNTYLDLCKGFVHEAYTPENNIERTEQIEVMNKSMDYFTKNEFFDNVGFEEEVLGGKEEAIQAFNNYKEQYAADYDMDINEEFSISENAVKKQKRYFKSVIKLDKNFHVYVHGDRANIQRGFDKERNQHFYQLYFDSED